VRREKFISQVRKRWYVMIKALVKCTQAEISQFHAGKGAVKVPVESAKDAAAGKDDEENPRRVNNAGKRPARRSSEPSKQVRRRGILHPVLIL